MIDERELRYLLDEQVEVKKIDWMKYIHKLWNGRMLIAKVAGIATLLGIVIVLTTPKQYTAKATLAPELTRSTNSGISNIASMLGVGGLNLGNDADALKVTLYPDIIASTPFILDLLDTQVSTLNKEQSDTTLIGYLKEYTNSSLISQIKRLPFKTIASIKSLFKTETKDSIYTKINPFQLTKEQAGLIKGLRKLITAKVDKKTGVTTITVTMQDPLVAALITDTVIDKLKRHITEYRISKAKKDYEYWEQIYNERKETYYQKQRLYADYVDANKNIILQSVRIEQTRLQNEMNLAYQVYSNVATQLQMAKAKIQEAKPVLATIEPASVPQLPSGITRKVKLIAIVFIAIGGAIAWVLFGQNLWNNIKTFIKKEKNNNDDSNQ